MPEKVIHEIRLNQYAPQHAGGNRLQLGTSHSYGIERLHLIPEDGWDGLAVTATFHSPAGLAVRMLMGTDGMVDVPPEATASAGLGKIVISGAADGVQRISCNLLYAVMEHAHTFGGTSTGPTPDVISQILASTLEDRKAAATSSAQAEDAASIAAASARSAAESAEAAARSATNAQGSADAAAKSAETAKTAETGAGSNAAAAKNSADQASASAAAANESQTAAKASQDAANASASTASSKATAAGNSAAAAATSEKNAAASSAAAKTAQSAAETAKTGAESAKTAADSSAKAAASSTSTASGAASTATTQAAAAKSSADNAASSATAAKSSETAAAKSAQVASSAETAAKAAQNAAETAKTGADTAASNASEKATAAANSAAAAKSSADAAAKSAEEAKAAVPVSTLDGIYAAMLDGTNTQTIFRRWWPFAVAQGGTKYSCLERFAAMLDTAWGDKTYTVRNIHESVSGDASGTPLDDLADGRSAAPLVTDASTGVADWAENDPMTWYVRANAKSLADGTMEILAVEIEDDFDVTGETAPVYCFSAALAIKEWDDGSYIYTSWHMRSGNGYVPMAGDVAPDGTHRLLTWHPAFYGGKNSAGGMTSGAGLLPMPWTRANAALPLARKLTAYDGLWCDCDTQFAMMAWRLRHWTLSNGGQLEGCTNYNYQYTLAAAETGVKRVLLTKDQGANLLVGSCVCLGERGSNTDNDRNKEYNHDVFNIAKILSVETATVNDTEYAAVNLDLASTIDTTTTMLVSTMPWPNGTTEALPGHSDGSLGSLTNGKYPYRIAGMEMQIGSYCEELDPMWRASLVDDDHWHYDVYSCRDSEKLDGSITANYQKVGEFALPHADRWSWTYIRALNKMAAEAQIPTKFGGSSSTYVKAAFISPGGVGVYAPWRFGSLNGSVYFGLPCVRGGFGPGDVSWDGAPRLAGSGKKRGEWPA